MSTSPWLSTAVENIFSARVGMVVLRAMRVVITPPAVCKPSDRGVTSNNTRSLMRSSTTASPVASSTGVSNAACTAAPIATTSSGLTFWHSAFPPKYSDRICCTRGMRVEPPTRTMSSTADASMPASARTWETGARMRWSRSSLMSSKPARVIVQEKSRPSKRASTWTVASSEDESSRFAVSAAVRRRRMARASARTPSTPASDSNWLARWCTTRSSKSSPPR
mmetsp:Transcript_10640/g.17881  ORF Transcript_10640/g.17881 Transcript_10640/m.17881 type:complete len:223 (-) Transcript_10640:882-1550(-)